MIGSIPRDDVALDRPEAPGNHEAAAYAPGHSQEGQQVGRRPSSARWRSQLTAYAVTVFVLVSLNFLVPRAMPGDPLTALVDPGASAYIDSEDLREDLERYYGLDRSLLEQYSSYLGDLVHGDFGTSIRYNQPVSGLIWERLPWTLLLVGAASGLAAVVGIPAGVHSGWNRGRPVDRRLLSVFLGVRNFPVFFLASIALFLFSVELGWVPLAGARTAFADLGFFASLVDIAHHLVLPASVLALRFIADNYLFMRAGMVGELGADYLMLGQAKGLKERRLKYGYAARNAVLPVVSLVAVQLGQAVTAMIFIEVVFAYPGLGRLLFDSVSFRDYPTLQACFLVLALVVVTANLSADLLYAKLDPRTVR